MHSTLFALSYFGRCVTATSWFLSAAWKVVHPREFSLAYGRITSHNLPMAAPAAWCLAVIEVTAGAILLLPAAPRIVAVTVSLALVILGLAAGGIVSLALMYLPEIRSVWLAGRKLVEVREL